MMKTKASLLVSVCLAVLVEAAWGESSGGVIYPKEIQNCEPCKRLWLANNKGASQGERSSEKKTAEANKAVTPLEKKTAETGKAVEKKPSSAVIYPREIENCEPCKRLWLVNRKKSRSDAAE